MPFVTDIAGPSGPSRRGRRSSSVRCAAPAPSTPIRPGPGTPTSTCGPATSWAANRARWTCSAGSACAHISQTGSSTTSPPIRTTTGWCSCGQSGRTRIPRDGRQAVPDEVRGQPAAPAARRLVGAALVSGYAVQHAAITLGIEEKLPAGTADHMAGICAGFAEDASLVPYAKRNGTIPSVHGPVAPPLDPEGIHTVEPLRPHGMRRFRRLDLTPTATSTPTSVTRTSTATVSRRSCTSTPSRARSTRRRGPSPR